MGGTRPTDINVIVGTRSMVGHGQYSDYKWSIVDMPGTLAMTDDCCSTQSYEWIAWPVHYAMENYGAGTHSMVLYI